MQNEKLSAFDESAQKANVIHMRGYEQPPVEDGYLDALGVPDNIDYVAYAKNRDTEKNNIKSPSEFFDEVLERITGQNKTFGASLPWVKTHDNLRFRPAEVTMWQGFNGHKKSMVLGYASLGFIQQEEPVCIASFEMKPASTIARMVKQATGTITPTKKALEKFIQFTDKKLWLYDRMGTVDKEALFGVMYYVADKLGCKHFIIDSLMRVVAGEDDYNGQKDFVTRLCEIAHETNMHIHFVHHNRKGDETKRAGRYGAKGSGSLSDNIHNALEVFQLPVKDGEEKEEGAPDMYIYCDKQREGEWEGAIALWFDPNSLQFLGSPDAGVRAWIR